MREPAYRLIQLSLVGAGACAAAGAGLLLPDLIARRPVGVWPMILAGVTWLAAILLFVRSWRAADRLGRGVRAIRMGVVTRSPQREKPNAGGDCEASLDKPQLFGVEVEPDVADWQCWRYRVSTVVVPMRNLVLGLRE